jgi:hypothetical protein
MIYVHSTAQQLIPRGSSAATTIDGCTKGRCQHSWQLRRRQGLHPGFMLKGE